MEPKASLAGELFSNEAISVAFCVVLKKAKARLKVVRNAKVYLHGNVCYGLKECFSYIGYSR